MVNKPWLTNDGNEMPVRKTGKGWRWGDKGKIYPVKWKAVKQGQAIQANKRKKGLI